MADHFSTIGFSIDLRSQSEFSDLVGRAYENGEKIETERGIYARWSSKSGAEVWCAVNEKLEFLNLTPAFHGESSRKVELVRPIINYKDTLEGSFYAWSGKKEDDPDSEAYPFMFDVPNFYTLPKYNHPKICNIQLSAFAHEIRCFNDEKEFYSDKSQTQANFALKAFIPSGLFLPGGGKRDMLIAEGIFTGEILKWKRLENELTDNSFIWMLVDTLGGQVDVVVDPSILNKEPVKGGYIMGSFWLSGRIINN